MSIHAAPAAIDDEQRDGFEHKVAAGIIMTQTEALRCSCRRDHMSIRPKETQFHIQIDNYTILLIHAISCN